ncbi:MAG: C2H2-type zinc finger protein, partial [Desulfobacteraceae bacterium]|nr:C2H2-type zinc finger protein [Desulfobacteraceae bacterium]
QEVGIEDLSIMATTITPPTASGVPQPVNLDEWITVHSGSTGFLTTISNNDKLCIARAIVCGIARAKKDDGPTEKRRWDTIRQGDRNRCTAQRKAAEELTSLAGISRSGPHDLNDIKKIQAAIPKDFEIKIWRAESAMGCIYQGGQEDAPHKIHLLMAKGHCWLITSISAFMSSSYFCETCHVGYNNRGDHFCKATCTYCETPGDNCSASGQPYIHCEDCNRNFPNLDCLKRHKIPPRGNPKNNITPLSTCERLKVCGDCGELIRQRVTHHCGTWWCGRCKKHIPLDEDHECFIRPVTEEPKKEISTMIFFDFETTQDTEIGQNAHGSIYGHDVKLAVVQKVSDHCKDTWDRSEQNCPHCGEHQRVFR